MVDANGQPISRLSTDAFSANLDGQPLTLIGVASASDPGIGIAVVLTFDVSGSMAGDPLDEAKSAGKALIDQLGPDDVAAIVAFSDGVSVAQGFTSDHAVLSQAIDGLSIGGNTALFSAVAQSIDLANQAPLGRRAIVLLSDGVDYGGVSQVDPASTVTSATDSGALLFAIGLGGNIDQDYLANLAQAGHGQFLAAPTPDDLRALYQTAGNVLRQQYVLTLDAGSLGPATGPGALEIQVDAGSGVASGQLPITVPQVVQTVPPTQAATVQPTTVIEQQPITQAQTSSTPWALVAGGLAIGAAVLTCCWLFLHRRRSRRVGEPALDRITHETAPLAFPTISRAAIPSGTPSWLEAPGGDRVPLGDAPLTVGFSPDCGLYLRNGGAGHLERARIWRRDGRFMLHTLSNSGTVAVSGRAVSWVVLEDGDEITLGNSRIVFHDPH